jgi:hypothetical protein
MTARLSLPPALVAALALVGCGASGSEVRGTHEGGPCPEGTRELRPRDVLPSTPAGTELSQADPKDAQRYVDAFKTTIGEQLKSVHTGVVTERGKDFGTAVVVINGDERMGDPRDILRGAQDNPQPGSNPQPYTVAGQPGMISEESDGAIVMGAVSQCAIVMLSGPDTPLVKRIAGRLESQE